MGFCAKGRTPLRVMGFAGMGALKWRDEVGLDGTIQMALIGSREMDAGARQAVKMEHF